VTLGGRRDVHYVQVAAPLLGSDQEAVDGVVVVSRVVMEQHQLSGGSLVGHLKGVVNGAMTPVGPLGELLGGELGVVDEEVHPVS